MICADFLYDSVLEDAERQINDSLSRAYEPINRTPEQQLAQRCRWMVARTGSELHYDAVNEVAQRWMEHRGDQQDIPNLLATIEDLEGTIQQLRCALYMKHLRHLPYKAYLKTEYWAIRRKRKLEAADHKCQLCNVSGELHVHHRTYERRGSELDEDLIVLCKHCHAKFHDKLPKSEADGGDR